MTIFKKMHGLGNDFVILDIRESAAPDQSKIRQLADRRRGIGCDQVLTMGKAENPKADLFMRIYNPDGSEAGACGNGARCVARLFMEESGRDTCVIETKRGLLPSRLIPDTTGTDGPLVEVDMGAPFLNWKDIPLAEERDTLHLGVMGGPLSDPVAVSMGNPHTVFFIEDAESFAVEEFGPQVECHVLFPERTNVEFAQILSRDQIRVRVWERGTGLTEACGSGACATMVAAARRGLTGRKAEIILDGGILSLEWRPGDDHVLMTGPAVHVYQGRLAAA
jgi:diaminopimelate epimerase